MKREFVFNGHRLHCDIDTTSGKVKLDSGDHDVICEELSPGQLVIQNSRGRYRARVARQKDRIYVWIAGRTFEFHIPSADEAGGHGETKPSDVRAPMPGTLIKLMVRDGDPVEEDQVVAVLEAMKMEHQLRAPRAGSVKKVDGAVGTVVDADAVIVTLEPVE